MDISLVIPTFNREQVLLDTIAHLKKQTLKPSEILVVDQTNQHAPATHQQLEKWAQGGLITWIRLSEPSIPRAMNVGLLTSRGAIVLFIDDDVVPDPHLLEVHCEAHRTMDAVAVVGRILQPCAATRTRPNTRPSGADDPDRFQFNSPIPTWITRVMAGNLSVKKPYAISAGGFDENFKGAAYRFEAEFAERLVQRGWKIRYEPAACLKHLKSQQGGTRTYGLHYSTALPYHSVGAYYYLLSVKTVRNRIGKIPLRLLKSVLTRHHLKQPWVIPMTIAAEVSGLAWAAWLSLVVGPKLLDVEVNQ